jgi:hypothetical protein
MGPKRESEMTGRLSRWDWLRLRAVELAVAFFLASITIQVVTSVRDYQKDQVSVSEWFVVNEIFVPDHVQGENPLIVYDREIRVDVRGFWLVEVQRRDIDGLTYTACSGPGVNDYEITDIIPDQTVTWEWFIGRPCVVDPGVYRLRVRYDFTRSGWPAKQLVVLSNVFTIRE